MCWVEALGNGASGGLGFSCLILPRCRGWNGMGREGGGASIRCGFSRMGDPSIIIGNFADPCSIERSMTSVRDKAGEATEESETETRPTSVGGVSTAELVSYGLEGGMNPGSEEHPSWLCPVHYVNEGRANALQAHHYRRL